MIVGGGRRTDQRRLKSVPSVFGHSSLLRKRRILRGLAGVGVVSTVLTIAMAWPVLRSPNELLFGTEIVGRHSDAYTVIRSFSDADAPPPVVQPGVDTVGSVLAGWIGAAAAYNLLVLLSFPLTAMATFPLARYLGVGRWPSAAVALVFAFSPLHISHAAYHPHVSQVHWIPLALLSLLVANNRWTPTRAVVLAAALAVAGLSNFYAAMILAAVIPCLQWVLKRHPVGAGEGWRATTWTLAGVAFLGLLCIAFLRPEVFTNPQGLAFPAADAEKYAARPYAYLTPAVENPVLGSLGRAVWARSDAGDSLVEQQVYLGWLVLALAIWGLVVWRRSPALSDRRAVPFLLVLIGAGLVLSLSPVIQIGWFAVPAPSWLLRAVAPMFRAYARFGFLVQLGVMLLAGLAVTWWLRERLRHRSWVVIVVSVLVLIELAPFPPWRAHSLYPNDGYHYLQNTDSDWSAIDCTLAPEVLDSVAVLVDRPLTVADGTVHDCGEPDLAAKLAAQGITHAIDRLDGPLSGRIGFVLTAPDLTGVGVYRVEAPPAAFYVRRWSGFSWREGAGEQSIRWSGSQAVLWLHNVTRTAETQTLELELLAFPEARNVTVTLNGEQIAELVVPADKTWFRLELPLQVPRNRLQLVPDGPPVTPDLILGNGDRRLLALAVGGIRYPRLQGPLRPPEPDVAHSQVGDAVTEVRVE